jgi:histidine phosphotransfer protein HptB
MDQAVVDPGYIYSRLAGDPDLGEIVELFVAEMPERVAKLLDELQAHDWEKLRRTAHQLKGAAGSYGFDTISPSAGKVESAIDDGQPEQRIRATVEDLVGLCNRTRCGVPEKQST